MNEDELAAKAEALLGEINFAFPDPVDALEDTLAEMLGLTRPVGISDRDWWRMRVAFIRERDEQADQILEEAIERAEAHFARRAGFWPYSE